MFDMVVAAYDRPSPPSRTATSASFNGLCVGSVASLPGRIDEQLECWKAEEPKAAAGVEAAKARVADVDMPG